VDIGSLSLALASALLLAKTVGFISTQRLAWRLDGKPGGIITSIKARTLGIIVIGQMVIVSVVFLIDALPQNFEHELQLGLILMSQVILLAALVTAWLSLRSSCLR